MNLLPKTFSEFSDKEYWEQFFKKRGRKAFEWYGEYPELCNIFHKYIKTKDEILIIGCGNSTLSCDLYDVGLKHITNIDISHVAIKQMLKINNKDRPGMRYLQMDALETSFNDNQFTVIIDKGTLDALMPDDSPETSQRIDKLFNEINRVLRLGGRYICISLLQSHILKKLLDYFPQEGWMFRICRCFDAEHSRSQESNVPNFPVFAIVCFKCKKLPNAPPVLELSLTNDNKIHRVASTKAVIDCITNIHQSVMVCSGLSRTNISDGGEMFLELVEPLSDSARYSIHLLDQPYSKKQGRRYAVFIVPQGRETEWLFSTSEGRNTLLKSSGFDRLAVVTLHRGQEYLDLKSVERELDEFIKQLAPPGLLEEIPYLSTGPHDVGSREICFRGNSEQSGDFIVEEIESDGGLYRRLIFLSNQNVIQSEARIKLLKSRKGKPKKVIDTSYIACDHHLYMMLGVAMLPVDQPCQVAIIGLGGGGLCTFMNHCFQKTRITAVDIDPVMLEVAMEYFNLVQNDRLFVYIRDGIQFLRQSVEKNSKFDVVMFDVDNKLVSTGLSCPPAQFLEPQVLNDVKQLLTDQGVFVLNLVCRDKTLRETLLNEVRNIFPSVCSYKLEQEVNEVIYCTTQPLGDESDWFQHRKRITTAAETFNSVAQKRRVQEGSIISIENLQAKLNLLS